MPTPDRALNIKCDTLHADHNLKTKVRVRMGVLRPTQFVIDDKTPPDAYVSLDKKMFAAWCFDECGRTLEPVEFARWCYQALIGMGALKTYSEEEAENDADGV